MQIGKLSFGIAEGAWMLHFGKTPCACWSLDVGPFYITWLSDYCAKVEPKED